MRRIKHVAIIMDGNGRWATSKLRPRIWGHIKGASIINGIAKEADRLGVRSLTLYAFSSENWSRPKSEVSGLLKILYKFLIKNQKNIIQDNIRFNVIGNYNILEKNTVDLIEETKSQTSNNTGLKLNFAFNYGSRSEIVNAVNVFMAKKPGQNITEEDLSLCLYDSEIKEIDLVIRTGGDQRLSNFLLWQSAYSEIEFFKNSWPDFKPSDFEFILNKYQNVEKKFGSLQKDLTYEDSIKISKMNQEELK